MSIIIVVELLMVLGAVRVINIIVGDMVGMRLPSKDIISRRMAHHHLSRGIIKVVVGRSGKFMGSFPFIINYSLMYDYLLCRMMNPVHIILTTCTSILKTARTVAV